MGEESGIIKDILELQKLLKEGVEISVRENGREKKIKYIGFFESGKMVIEGEVDQAVVLSGG